MKANKYQTDHSMFSYKNGSSPLHKCPAWCKILAVPVLSALVFCLPPYFSVILIALQIFLACTLHFSVKEQLADLKPVIYYAFLLIFVNFLSFLGDFLTVKSKTLTDCKEIFFSTAILLAKLFCVMQSASLLFKTSTLLQIRGGIEQIELFFRRIFRLKHKAALTNIISLFVLFIPMISKIWSQTKRAWYARGGRHNIRMYVTLLPVLFGVGMKKAFDTALSVQART